MAGLNGRIGKFSLDEKHLIFGNGGTKSMNNNQFHNISCFVGMCSSSMPKQQGETIDKKINSEKNESSAESTFTVSPVNKTIHEKSPRDIAIEQTSKHILPAYNWDGTGGCLTCGMDDDYALLLICELCNAEYHTYCLNPPLESVPEGDFYCDNCKPFKTLVPPKESRQTAHSSTNSVKDQPFPDSSYHLDHLISALPPQYTSRFGEIVWAAGGVGFGWWPACIYDPRLTVGNAQTLAKRNLGKKHLIYFFECHDAPFTVLGDNKICSWIAGYQEEYDLGRTAKSVSKSRGILFDKALMVANLEYEKPLELRLDWNHQDEDLVIKGRTRISTQQRELEKKNELEIRRKQKNIEKTNNEFEDLRSSRRRRRGASYSPSSSSTPTIRIGLNRPRRGARGKSQTISVETEEEAQALAEALKLSVVEEEQRKLESSMITETESNTAPIPDKIEKAEPSITKVKRKNFDAALSILTSKETESINNKSLIFCKIFLRKSMRAMDFTNAHENCDFDENHLFNIGFVTITNTNCFYEKLRATIEIEICNDNMIASSLPKKWKFYAPNLGPMSESQEKQFRLEDFISNSKNDEIGTYQCPYKVIIQDFTNGLILHKSVGSQVNSSDFQNVRKRSMILPTIKNKKQHTE